MKASQRLAASGLGLPPDSYIYSIVPTSPQSSVYSFQRSSHLASICSDDSLRVFDAETLTLSPGGLIRDVNRSVTCLKRFDADGNIFATCGRDGLVRAWDRRSNKKVLEAASPKGLPFSALECSSATNAIAAGTELEGNGPGEASVYIWDSRKPSSPLLELSESHTDTVTVLQFHPQHTSLLLSGSTDSLVNIFSIDQATEEDALHQIINHRSAIHHAGFLNPSTCIFGLGTDETLSVYALQNPDEAIEEPAPQQFGDIREPLNCEYAINVAWMKDDSYLAVGNHSTSSLRLIRFDTNLKPEAAEFGFAPSNFVLADRDEDILLSGAHGEEIVRDIYVDSESSVAFTCGEDGQVKSWKLADGSAPEGSKSEKKAKDGKARKHRFQPY